ncbi:hypothetical protein Tco_0482390 [Tanacetum coccineum]
MIRFAAMAEQIVTFAAMAKQIITFAAMAWQIITFATMVGQMITLAAMGPWVAFTAREEARIAEDVEANQKRLLTVMLQMSLIPHYVAGTCDETLVHVGKKKHYKVKKHGSFNFVAAGNLFECMLLRSVDTPASSDFSEGHSREHPSASSHGDHDHVSSAF